VCVEARGSILASIVGALVSPAGIRSPHRKARRSIGFFLFSFSLSPWREREALGREVEFFPPALLVSFAVTIVMVVFFSFVLGRRAVDAHHSFTHVGKRLATTARRLATASRPQLRYWWYLTT
jgi:hypothetical protein